MAERFPSRAELRLIRDLLNEYEAKYTLVNQFETQLVGALRDSPELAPHVHSLKSRLKNPEHLRSKLIRKMRECKQESREFTVTSENLLVKINDLVGVRVLHLHTRQIRAIDEVLRTILLEQQYDLIEGPFARTWDDESRQFMRESGIETQESPSMYTSVHYVVSSASRTKITAEIQVRTLMEEVWGEVDHTIMYPEKMPSLACREQLKVLARATSTATRLVDSIFLTMESDEQAARDSVEAERKREAGTTRKRASRRLD